MDGRRLGEDEGGFEVKRKRMNTYNLFGYKQKPLIFKDVNLF